MAVLVAVIVALGLWSYFQVYIAPDYGTDEIAFDQYAAQLALHGINPYLHSMAAAFPLFHVSPNGYTFLLNGQPVTSCPTRRWRSRSTCRCSRWGSAPRPRSGPTSRPGRSAALVLYAVLPRKLAPLAAIVVSLDVFTGYAVGGVTDFLFMPLLSARRPAGTGSPGRGAPPPGAGPSSWAWPWRSSRRPG